MDIAQSWRRFLMEWEAAKNYHSPYVLIAGWTMRNPLIEHMLPALLQLRALSVLDEALETYISDHGLDMPRKYRKTLEGRICFLAAEQILANDADLHAARDRRNSVAHELHAGLGWDSLSQGIDAVEATLIRLGYVGTRPQMAYFGDRSAIESCDEPGVLGVREFRFGVKEADSPVFEASWRQKLYTAGQ